MGLKSFHTEGVLEAGCDEAGRGCLAGPVFAAAVILPAGYFHPRLNDSKKLSSREREGLRKVIEEAAIAWAVGSVSPEQIDEMNILNASYLAMHQALDALPELPEHILVDGNRFKPYKNIASTCIVKGDGKYLSIAAASILAKTYRDDFMEKIHQEFPYYNWLKNKGYPTREHRAGIKKYGASIWHRRSFRLLNEQLFLDFSEGNTQGNPKAD